MPSYIEHACVDCGKVRLVQTHFGKARNLRCKSCSKVGTNHPQYGKVGEDAAHWKGGQTIDNKGYVWIYMPKHPKALKCYVKRALLVLEDMLGRFLQEGFDSHHKNEIKDDDRPENLEEIMHGSHSTLHLRERNFNQNEPGLRVTR